jgi:alkaline phosphatase D
MAKERLDLIVHLGDYIYEFTDSPNNVRLPADKRGSTVREAAALRDYRNRFALYHTDPDLRAAHESAPWVVTWDDHEVAGNYADDISSTNDPVVFLQRRADAYQAYYEHMPLRPSSLPVGPDLSLYRHLPFGDLLQFFVLDTRQYRTEQPAGDGVFVRSPGAIDPATTMLGAAQERWLQQELAESGATWNVLAQQNFMAETYVPVKEGEAQKYYADSWTGYPLARDRMLAQIREQQVANPIVLTGDIHTAWANDLKADWEDLTSPTIATEYVVTSISAGGATPSTSLQPYKDNFEYVKYFDGRHGGFTLAEVTAEQWKSDYYVVDNLNDVTSAVSHTATFVTEAGNPGAQEG